MIRPTALVVPRGAEAAAVKRAATGLPIVEVAAGAAASRALPEFAPDDLVVVLGLCGALRGLSAGEVAIYSWAADAASTFALDPALVGTLAHELPQAHVVSACTAGRIVTTIEARAKLAERFDADVVDMEGTYLSAALGERGVRFAMVRVVSDDASRNLPPIDDAIDEGGHLRPLLVAGAFARAPIAAYAFVRDVRLALAKLTEIARAISAAVA